MKLLTFNIFRGGIDEHGSRIHRIIDVIKEENPDFVALQEADDFERNNSRLLREISERTGLRYYDLSPGTPRAWDKPSHVASLSRYEMTENHKFSGCTISGGALLTVIDSPVGKLAICNFHLDAYSEQIRLRELADIWKRISMHENQILLGDFNSVSLGGDYDPETIEVEYSFAVSMFSCTASIPKIS